MIALYLYICETLVDAWGLTFGDREATIKRIAAERAKTDYRL